MISVSNLVKAFGSKRSEEVRAVDGVSFTVPRGRFFTLLGPSGCGKTTTLRCVAGLERPTAGSIELDDTVVVSDAVFVPPHRRDVGMVFQSYAVWPHLSVFENVAFPLRVAKGRVAKRQIADRVRETLELVGLGGYEQRKPAQLSGGQQQRLSLARALVHQPRCLLFDEPLSNLDAKLRERMRGELNAIQRTLGFTALYVTHDQVEALSLSDEIAVMHEGRIVQQGTPQEIYYRPAERGVAEFLGSTNIIRASVAAWSERDGSPVQVDTEFGRWSARCAPAAEPAVGDEVLIGVRPEDVVILRRDAPEGDTPNRIAGTVETVAFGGAVTDIEVEVGGAARIRVQANSRIALAEGDAVRLEIDPQACSLLPLGHDAPGLRDAVSSGTAA